MNIIRRKKKLYYRALLEGQSIACVSDAGTPAISDPGADLVKAIEVGYNGGTTARC